LVYRGVVGGRTHLDVEEGILEPLVVHRDKAVGATGLISLQKDAALCFAVCVDLDLEAARHSHTPQGENEMPRDDGEDGRDRLRTINGNKNHESK
jgi:hypothetical protein